MSILIVRSLYLITEILDYRSQMVNFETRAALSQLSPHSTDRIYVYNIDLSCLGQKIDK